MIASWGDAKYIDRTAKTHILLAARGKNLGYMMLHSARNTAYRLKEMYPNDQVVLISVEEKGVSGEDSDPDYSRNKKTVEANGFSVRHQLKSEFDIDSMVAQMDTFKQIASLHVFSHSTPQFGALIDGKWNRIEVDGSSDKRFLRLRDNFTRDGYVYFHGCNAGFMLAPQLARVLGVPVAGALTSTNFQTYGADGTWNSVDKQDYPAGFAPAKSSNVFASKTIECKGTNCLRMRPSTGVYRGYWGKQYSAGLPIYKFFCPGKSAEDCKVAMLRGIVSTPSVVNLNSQSSFEDYKAVVKDIFCPAFKDTSKTKKCYETLDNAQANREYVPFRDKALSCDQNGCKFQFTCGNFKAFFLRSDCDIDLKSIGRSTTYVDDYLDTLDAYKYLRSLR
jgi:hypothetical protein